MMKFKYFEDVILAYTSIVFLQRAPNAKRKRSKLEYLGLERADSVTGALFASLCWGQTMD